MDRLREHVLASWRDAQRLVDENPPGTPEHDVGLAAEERLHELYAALCGRSAESSQSPPATYPPRELIWPPDVPSMMILGAERGDDRDD